MLGTVNCSSFRGSSQGTKKMSETNNNVFVYHVSSRCSLETRSWIWRLPEDDTIILKLMLSWLHLTGCRKTRHPILSIMSSPIKKLCFYDVWDSCITPEHPRNLIFVWPGPLHRQRAIEVLTIQKLLKRQTAGAVDSGLHYSWTGSSCHLYIQRGMFSWNVSVSMAVSCQKLRNSLG